MKPVPVLARAFALFVAASLPVVASALDPSVLPTQYVREHWGRAEGIPDGWISALAEGKDGYLWIGTETGLVRFDGARFVRYGEDADPSLRSAVVTSLLSTRDGALLVGTRTGLIELRSGVFRRLERGGGDAEAVIRDLFEDGSGRIWVGSDGDLGYFEKGSYRVFRSPAGEPLRGFSHVRASADGSLWFLWNSTAARFRDGKLETIPLAGHSLFLSAGSSGVVRTFSFGAMEELGGSGSRVARDPLLEQPALFGAVEDRDGGVWVAGSDRVVRRRGGKFEIVPLEPPLAYSATALLETRDGAIFLGTSGGGLYRLRNPRILTFGREEGLPLDRVQCVLEARDGALWLAAPGHGLVRRSGNVVRTFGSKDGLPADEPSALLETKDGGMFVGTVGGLARLGAGDRFEGIPLSPKAPCIVLALSELADGTILVGTTVGLFAGRGGRFREIARPEGEGNPSAFLPDGDRGAFVGTLGLGLHRFDGEKLSPIGTRTGLTSKDVATLARDSRGRLLVGTVDQGLFVRVGDRFRNVGRTEGLPPGPVYGVVESEGSLWLSGKDGVTQIPLADFEALLSGRSPQLRAPLRGAADGMRDPECNGGGAPTIWRARDGAVWVPTNDGVVRVDPRRFAEAPKPPTALLEEALVDGEPAPQAGGTIRLSPRSVRLEIRFSAAGFPDPASVRFEHRLGGFDRDWIDAGTRRYASYTSLPPGTYLLEVRTRTPEGAHGAPSAPRTIVREPWFWQTKTFLAALLATVAAAVFLVHRLRMATLRRRFDAVLEERNRISREIHDSLTQSFAGVVLQLEAADRSFAADPGTSRERASRASAIAREGLAEARRFVRGLRPLALEAADLPAAIGNLAAAASAEGKAQVRFRSRGRARALSPHVEDQLFRIAQEAVQNALRHAEAGRVDIELELSPREARLLVADDGRGFDPAAVRPGEHGGFGLRGMRERVEAMKGAFSIDGAEGKGTRIEVRIPAA